MVEVYSKVHEAIQDVRPGEFFRISYRTAIKPSKRRCNENLVDADCFNIYKIVSTTVRTGVAYSNIRRVAQRLEEKPVEKKQVTNNWAWIDRNTCKFNTNTSKFYLCCATIPQGGNCKISYLVEGKVPGFEEGTIEMSKDDFEHSFFNEILNDSDKKQKAPCEYFTVSFENILSINGKELN